MMEEEWTARARDLESKPENAFVQAMTMGYVMDMKPCVLSVFFRVNKMDGGVLRGREG